ncbi:MAG: phage tail family protein [Candidatus Omnitrophica bacterium]|nr:phage tail family protein [Candidatus Omnitrophota bacterium]
MPRIGTFTLPITTLINEKTELILGRIRKVVSITTVLEKFASRSAYETAVSDLEKEIERLDRGHTDLSIHGGRFLQGRRRKWNLIREDDICLAVASLEFLADDRFERSEEENSETFPVTTSPESFDLSPDGNWNALPILELTATTALTNPSFSDGTRTLPLTLDLDPGDKLVIDSDARTAMKNDTENVLNSTSGEFPQLAPGSASIEYSDETVGSPAGSLTVRWRDRWV